MIADVFNQLVAVFEKYGIFINTCFSVPFDFSSALKFHKQDTFYTVYFLICGQYFFVKGVDIMAEENKVKEFWSVFIKSAVITISAVTLILIGYFTAGFLSGGL